MKAVRSGAVGFFLSAADASDANIGVANATPLPRKNRRRDKALAFIGFRFCMVFLRHFSGLKKR